MAKSRRPVAAAPIYRLPPMVYGPMVSIAQTGEDKVDWGLKAHGIPDEWKETQGEGVLVGVADTGKPVHPDLTDAIVDSRNFTRSFTDEDSNGHSTHVCGTIGARLDGKGVVGVAPKCKIMTAKVLGDDGSGDNLMVASGIRWLHQQGCKIINMSLGGGFDPTITQAVKEAVDDGVFVICAAGNDGDNGGNTVGYPAKLPFTVAVASYNEQGNLSRFSSRGMEVHIAFPGENILSTWPNNSFRRISGTSMATPFCAGLVALMQARQLKANADGKTVERPVTNNLELIAALKDAAVDRGPLGQDRGWGWGVVDTDKFLDGADAIDGGGGEGGGGGGGTDTPADETDLFGFLRIRYPVTVDGKEGAFLYLPW